MSITWIIIKTDEIMDETRVTGPMKNPVHPGQILKGLYLEPLDLSVTEAAEGLGVNRKTLSQLVNGRSSVTPDMALRLAEAFNTTPQVWLNLQQNFDLRRAEKKAKKVKQFWPAASDLKSA